MEVQDVTFLFLSLSLSLSLSLPLSLSKAWVRLGALSWVQGWDGGEGLSISSLRLERPCFDPLPLPILTTAKMALPPSKKYIQDMPPPGYKPTPGSLL